MSTVQLERAQYNSHDEDGEIIATRAVQAWNLDDQSEFGPGITVHLRTDYEPPNDDGIGVELSITDKQLEELGYFTKDQVVAALMAQFPSFDANADERSVTKRLAIASVDGALGIETYSLDLAIENEPKEPAPDKDEQTFFHVDDIPDLFPLTDEDEDDLFPEGFATLDELEFPEKPINFAYDTYCRKMVDPLEKNAGGELVHDQVEVYCEKFGWVPAGVKAGDGANYMRHAFDEECIDKTAVKSVA